jgi:hypothetical protein
MISRVLKLQRSSSLLSPAIRDRPFRNASSSADSPIPPKESHIPLQGKFKNPIVSKLWTARQEAKAIMSLTVSSSNVTDVTRAAAADLQRGKNDEGDTIPNGKTPEESMQSITYPFSSDEFLLETYRNPWGQMRFGKVG